MRLYINLSIFFVMLLNSGLEHSLSKVTIINKSKSNLMIQSIPFMQNSHVKFQYKARLLLYSLYLAVRLPFIFVAISEQIGNPSPSPVVRSFTSVKRLEEIFLLFCRNASSCIRHDKLMSMCTTFFEFKADTSLFGVEGCIFQ